MGSLPSDAVPWVVGALLCLWLALRVSLLRGRLLAARAHGEPEPNAAGWLRALALRAWVGPVLLGLLGACLALAWRSWR